MERRFQSIVGQDPAIRKEIVDAAQQEILGKFAIYERMSTQPVAAANWCAVNKKTELTTDNTDFTDKILHPCHP